MGQSLSNSNSASVSRVEYDSIVDRCLGMEQLNKELKVVVSERDVEIKQISSRIEAYKNEVHEKNIYMLDFEKQAKYNANRYSLAENHVDTLVNEKNELLVKLSEQDEKIKEIFVDNEQLNSLVKHLQKSLDDTKTNDYLQEAEIEKLQNKNLQLRSQANKLQEELSLYKKNLSLINNLVDQVQESDETNNEDLEN